MKELGKYRKYILVFIDGILINISYILAIYFRYEYGTFLNFGNDYKSVAIVFTIIYLICFINFYR